MDNFGINTAMGTFILALALDKLVPSTQILSGT